MNQEELDKMARIVAGLPHGSGIDAEWSIALRRDKIVCHNSYHVMSDRGFYVGWAEFDVHIPDRHPTDFALHFLGRRAQYLARYYDLRSYLEDTILQAMWEAIDE